MSYEGEYDSREWPSGYKVGKRYVPEDTVRTVHAPDCNLNREKLQMLCLEIEKLHSELSRARIHVPLDVWHKWEQLHIRARKFLDA